MDIAYRGVDALERALGGQAYALILCDLNMSGMTGIDVLATLAHEEPCLLKRFVLMTGLQLDASAIDELRRIKPDLTVLEKPFAPGQVVALAESYLSSES